MRQKSDVSSSTFGMTSSGNVDGEKTRIDSTRQRDKISGMAGAGPSEFEVEVSDQTQEKALRGLQDKFQEYQKLSESVLESEAIPLGTRQIIRRYFQDIRPTAAQAEAADREARADGDAAATDGNR